MKCQCGKKWYPSEWRAVDALKKANEQKGFNLKRAYRCPSGLGWHLTSQSKRKHNLIERSMLAKEYYKYMTIEEKFKFLEIFMDKWITARIHHAHQYDPTPLPTFERFVLRRLSVRIARKIKNKK